MIKNIDPADYSKSEIDNETRETVDMDSYVNAYYIFNLKKEFLEIIKKYSRECSYVHEEFDLPNIESYRACDLNFVEEGSKIHKIISGTFKQLNEKHFHYDLCGTIEVQIIRYKVGGNYNWHADYGLSHNKENVRKLSISMQLSNFDEYEGGELIICDHSRNYFPLGKRLGDSIIFDSKSPHKACPVKSGTRYVLVAWAHGPQLR